MLIVGSHRFKRKSCSNSEVICVNFTPFGRISPSTSPPPVFIVRSYSSTYGRLFFAEQGRKARIATQPLFDGLHVDL
ncbi:hypothetical protein GMOD_00001978 [Pyrenophora seminiperda CCB06]|uniref:Uncharacterized protein n=1 Tax=Pyrenophora seminiperda CCB06 TaxID=1302712 RepID=A0A3M7LWJ5_9PLEO|nr:hypothetical protein GMOD_00001978 [Pyrenophora seminiperda CCB06]